MKVEYFIGIVPPKEYMERIERFQKEWVNDLGVEPHITLKAQGGLTEDKKWIDKVENVCKNIRPFELCINKPTYFGDNIVYLSVKSQQLHNLHKEIVRKIAPSDEEVKKYFELEDFVPHLTLAKEQYGGNISTGLSKQQLKEMELLAVEELTPYPTFKVNFIRIYELNVETNKYEKYIDIPVGFK